MMRSRLEFVFISMMIPLSVEKIIVTMIFGESSIMKLSKYHTCKFSKRFKMFGTIGQKKLLCGNVRNFSMTKNGCAHRVQQTRISLGPNFGASSSLIFKDF